MRPSVPVFELQTRLVARRFGLPRNRAKLLAEHAFGEARK